MTPTQKERQLRPAGKKMLISRQCRCCKCNTQDVRWRAVIGILHIVLAQRGLGLSLSLQRILQEMKEILVIKWIIKQKHNVKTKNQLRKNINETRIDRLIRCT
jgi:hypothetical protein